MCRKLRMNAPPAAISSKDADKAREEIRGPELGSALKRDRLLQRVRTARKRLSKDPPNGPAGNR
jgi:hypothetical protein